MKNGTSIGDGDGDDGGGDGDDGGSDDGPTAAWTRTLRRGREGCRPSGVGRAGSGGGGEARVSSMGVSSSSPPPAPPPPDPDPRIREWSIASRELRADVGSADDIAMAAGVLDSSRNAHAARTRRRAGVVSRLASRFLYPRQMRSHQDFVVPARDEFRKAEFATASE